jgi:hypothetical protein
VATLIDLGVLLLAHRRPALLPLIVRQIKGAWPLSCIQIALDRPSPAVLEVVQDLSRVEGVEVLRCPLPAVAERENFMQVRAWQHEQMLPRAPKYMAIWDDDHVLEATAEAKADMEWGVDLIYAVKAFLWDSLALVNTKMPEHRSVLFFRVRPEDRFPLDRMIHAPTPLHDHPTSTACLGARLIDVGYLDAAERAQIFARYARAGKIDAATKPLVEPSAPKRFNTANHDLMDEVKAALK